MRPMNVLTIHGIGWSHSGTRYARPLHEGIRREFDRTLKGLHLKDVDRPNAKQALRFESVFWAPVTQDSQEALMRVLFGRPGLLRRLRLTYIFRRNLIALVGDVIAYEHNPGNSVYGAIHAQVDQCITQLSEASQGEHDSSGNAPLTIIGHSLGSVIASDYVWDNTRSTGHSHILAEHNLALVNFIAIGSPMSLYTLRDNAYGLRDSIREGLDCPIHVEPESGLWLNMYDRQDAVACPLEPIESYKAAGVIDCPIQAGNWLTGWNVASHVGYWQSEDVMRAVGRKLALDWARLNSPRFADQDFARANAQFRKELKKL